MMLSFSRIAVRRVAFMPMAAGAGQGCTASGRLVNPASAAAVSRSIATATPPLMAKRRKIPIRKKQVNTAKPTLAEKKAKLQAELDELDAKDEMDRRQAAGVYDFAPLIVKSPVYPPSISIDEHTKKINALFGSLLAKATAKFDEGGQEEDNQGKTAALTTKDGRKRLLLTDLRLIQSGKIALSEYRFAIQLAAHKTGKAEAKQLIYLFSDRYWMAHQGIGHYQKNLEELFELKTVSEELRAEIHDNLKVHLSAEFNPTIERLDNRLFKEVSKKAKESYLKQKADIMHSYRGDIFQLGGGPSMLPTLPAHITHVVERRILKEDWARMEVDDVVSFVFTKDDGQTVNGCKRITALAGDAVVYKGQKVIVPKGAVWCEGDNKDESYDSRQAGAVPFENLRSRCIFSYDVDRGHFKYLGRRHDDIWWLLRAFLGLES